VAWWRWLHHQHGQEVRAKEDRCQAEHSGNDQGRDIFEVLEVVVEPEKDIDATVKVTRKGGYDGPIDLEFTGSDGVTVEPAKITIPRRRARPR